MKRHRSGSGDYDRKRRHYDDHHHSESRSYGTDESAEDDEVGHLNVFPGDWIGERCASLVPDRANILRDPRAAIRHTLSSHAHTHSSNDFLLYPLPTS